MLNFFFFEAKNPHVTFAETTNEKKQFTKTKTWRSILNLIGHRFLWYICKTDITHQWRGTWNYILKPLSVNHSSHSFSYLHFENVMFTYGFKKDILDQYSMVLVCRLVSWKQAVIECEVLQTFIWNSNFLIKWTTFQVFAESIFFWNTFPPCKRK